MNNIYSPPKSNLVGTNKYDTKKRPKWVWVISIFYVISMIWTLLSFYLVLNGKMPLPEAQKIYFENLNIVDWALTLTSIGLSLFAAITLFFLKKITINAWATVIIFNVASLIYNISSSNWLQAVGGAGGSGAIVGYVIMIAVYFYAVKLNRRGYLK